MIIGGKAVITGSFNFTKAAEEKNAEKLPGYSGQGDGMQVHGELSGPRGTLGGVRERVASSQAGCGSCSMSRIGCFTTASVRAAGITARQHYITTGGYVG